MVFGLFLIDSDHHCTNLVDTLADLGNWGPDLGVRLLPSLAVNLAQISIDDVYGPLPTRAYVRALARLASPRQAKPR